MEEISLNGGEGFQEASWGVGNVFKKFEEYTPLQFTPARQLFVCGLNQVGIPWSFLFLSQKLKNNNEWPKRDLS